MAVRVTLAWLGALCGALVVCLSDALPFTLAFIRPASFHTVLVHCQLFFVLLAWPFLLDREVGGSRLLLRIGLLEILALPLVLVCSNISDAPTSALLRGQALVAALFLFVAALFRTGAARGWGRVAPAYVLSVFVLGAGLPFLGFLLCELAGTDPAGLYAVSPFRGAAEVEGPLPLVQALVFAAAGVALLVLDARRGAGVDAPAAAG